MDPGQALTLLVTNRGLRPVVVNSLSGAPRWVTYVSERGRSKAIGNSGDDRGQGWVTHCYHVGWNGGSLLPDLLIFPK